MGKVISFFITIIIVLILFTGCTMSEQELEDDILLVQYYYENICGSCDPETEFLQSFEKITGISQRTPNLKIEMYNVYEYKGLTVWKQVVNEFELESEQYDFPILRVGNEFKSNKILYNMFETALYFQLLPLIFL